MGVITLPWSMEQDRENQIKANSVHVDDNFNTLLNATNGKLEADGSIVPTADLPMGSHKITGLATPTNSADAATKGYVDSRDNTFDATYVKLSGPQTINDVKTFTASPVVPTPTNNSDATTKKYVDDSILTLSSACVKLSGTQSINGVKTFTSSPVVPTPTNNTDACTKKYVDDRLAGCVKTSGAQTINDVKTFTSSPVIPTPTTNMQASTKKYVDDSISTLSSACVKLSGTQTINGSKTFSSTITGSITGNAGTVTNGVYTTGDQTIGGTKTFSSTISGSINGNAATVTNGVYTVGGQYISGTKTFAASPIVPTVATTDNSQKAASTAFIKSLLGNHYVTEFQAPTQDNNYTWYRKYADGWVEQGGTVTPTASAGHKFPVPLPVTMNGSNYNVQVTIIQDTSNNNPTYASVGARSKSTTYFEIYDTTDVTKDWVVFGMAA